MARRYRTRQFYTPRSVRKFQSRAKRKILLTIVISLVLIYLSITKGIPLLIDGISVIKGNNPTTSPKPKINVTLAPPTLIIPFDATNSGVIQVLGYATPESQIELYIDEQLTDTTTTDTSGNFNFSAVVLNLGLNSITGKTLSSDGTKSLPSKAIVLDYSTERPTIEILEPVDGKTQSGEDKKVKISGKTNASDIQLQVQGSAIYVNSEGNFETIKDLSPGENIFVITAINKYGSTTQISRKVIFTP